MLKPFEALGGKFPIGIDNVPIRTMADWQARGCNFITRSDLEGGNVKPRQWWQAAQEFGFSTIRPATNPADDAADPTLIAVNLPDEPDLSSHWYAQRPEGGWPGGVKVWDTFAGPSAGQFYDLVGKEQGNPPVKTGATMAAAVTVYASRSKLLRAAYPNLPIFGNFAGNSVTSGMQEADYIGFTSVIDWVASDWYPVDADLTPFPVPAGAARRYGYHFPAKAVGRLLSWSGGKPNFAYISCVNQRLDRAKAAAWRWPDTVEIECQVWAALCAGACGIIYFSMAQNPWFSDGISATVKGVDKSATPEQVAAANKVAAWMPKFNAGLQTYADFLNTGMRQDISAGYPPGVLSCVWTLADGSTLKALVNTLGSSVTAAALYLDPCQVRITVKRAAPAPIPTPIPEPSPPAGPSRAEFDALSKRLAFLEMSIGDAGARLKNAASYLDAIADELTGGGDHKEG